MNSEPIPHVEELSNSDTTYSGDQDLSNYSDSNPESDHLATFNIIVDNNYVEYQDEEEDANMPDSIIITETRFCTICNFEQPIRAKHCRDCDRCVALHDHHCP